jgi:hypothetical protein
VTTALQTLFDMKNAMSVTPTQPGEFVASGHDYSGDLARFVREAYALTCTDEQLERIETALRGWQGKIQAAIDAQKAAAAAPTASGGNGAAPNTAAAHAQAGPPS